MKRIQAIPYVSFTIDSHRNIKPVSRVPDNAILVGWQCGFEPLFVAVDSDIGDPEQIATSFLEKRCWFSGEPTECDYYILPESNSTKGAK
jgi:hypothetical protein